MTETKKQHFMAQTGNSNRDQIINTQQIVSQSALISGICHDINNDNHAIMLNAQLLKEIWLCAGRNLLGQTPDSIAGFSPKELENEIPQYLDAIIEGCRSISDTVKEMRSFTNFRNDTFDLVNLNASVAQAVNLSKKTIAQKTVNFHCHLCQEQPLIHGQMAKIQQAVLYLIENSCEALTDMSQSITVSTGLNNRDQPFIAVEDDGPGIPYELKYKVTTPYFSTKNPEEHRGLGLTAAMLIIQRHNGSLSFKSTPDKSTKFIMTFPVTEEKKNAQ